VTADVHCRLCQTPLTETLVDLGMTPLANSYLPIETHEQEEPFYPLHARVCSSCYLVQLPAVQTSAHIFSDYAYFSSYSTSWLAHAKAYTDKMTQNLNLTKDSFVVEVASNDGYLLQYFTENSIPV